MADTFRSMNIQELQQISKSKCYLVYGFIRESDTENKTNIPDEIIQILHLAIIEKHPYNFISKKHNVSEK